LDLMMYPPPPWNLEGYAFQTLQLLDIDRVSSLIPSELGIVSVLPGKTLGGVYVASYGAGSVMTYNELIVVSAVVHHGGKIGAWISHIYVDNPNSVAGGREIWGLPKELAQFTWDLGKTPHVQVRQGDELLCTLNCRWQLPGWQQALRGSVFSVVSSNLAAFEGRAKFKLALANTDLQVPSESPFAWLGLGQAWLSFQLNPLQLAVRAPQVVHANH
jgi:acetoacetate decarboxylase